MAQEIKVIVTVDKSQLNSLQSDINGIKKTNVNIKTDASGVDAATKSVRNLGAATKETSKLTDIMGDSLGNIAVKMTAWMVMGNVVAGVVRTFREALTTMREVDQELTNIQKVSDLSAESLKRIGDTAYDVASKYGVAADEYLKAVYTFQKAGLGESAEQMAELATKTMLVGDTTAEVATRFLISANAAWKLGGDINKLSKIVDEADYINNNYATTLSDIATGLPIVGATAAQVGMTTEQTMAAIGTIVASTGQSATKAATALRAIIMNLIGETGELDDGLVVTEETIASLNTVLNVYAADAMKAAEATGSIVDPMEAIAALAKAAEDGFLNEAQLFEVLSGLGGKLRTTQLTALVNNMEMYHSMLQDTADAAGTADKEISVMLESWNAKTQILTNTFTKFISHLVDSNGIKAGIDILTGFVRVLDSGVGKVAAMTAVIYGVVKGVIALTAAVKTLNVAMLSSPLFIAAAAAAVIYGIVTAVDALTDSYAEQKAKLEELQSQYDQMYGPGSEYDQLLQNADKLNEKELIRLGTLKAQADELERQVKYQTELALKAWRSTQTRRETRYNGTGSQYSFTNVDIDVTAETVSAAADMFAELDAELASGTATMYGYEQGLSNIVELLDDDAKILIDAKEAGKELEPEEQELVDLYEKASTALGKLTAQQETNTKATVEQAQTTKAETTSLADAMKEAENTIGDAAVQAAMEVQFLALQEAMASGQPIDTSSAISSLSGLSAQSTNTAAALQALISVFKQIDAMDKRIADYQTLAVGEMGYEYAGYLAKFTAERTGFDVVGAFQTAYAEALANMPSGGGGGGSSGAKTQKDEYLEWIKGLISYQKQYLSYMEASGAPVEDQVAQMRDIQKSLHEQAEYLRTVEGESENVVSLSTEWWNIQEKINKALDDTADKEKAVKEELEAAKDAALEMLDAQEAQALGPYQRRLELLKAQKDAISDQREEEEKLLAIEKAKIALENAQRERNIRQYNAATGQWEWVADAQAVEQAREALADAERALNDFYRDRSIKALEKNIDTIQKSYDMLREQIENFAKAVANGTMTVAEALTGIGGVTGGTGSGGWLGYAQGVAAAMADPTSGRRNKGGGVGTGNSIALSSSTTRKLLSGGGGLNPNNSSIVTAGTGKSYSERIATAGLRSNPSNNYNINGVSISEAKAKSTTVYDLAQLSHKLSLHNA